MIYKGGDVNSVTVVSCSQSLQRFAYEYKRCLFFKMVLHKLILNGKFYNQNYTYSCACASPMNNSVEINWSKQYDGKSFTCKYLARLKWGWGRHSQLLKWFSFWKVSIYISAIHILLYKGTTDTLISINFPLTNILTSFIGEKAALESLQIFTLVIL